MELLRSRRIGWTNLFHCKCGSDEYGVEAAKYGHKPLYVKIN